VVEPKTSKAVSPSLFAFQSSEEGASYLYSQSSNESVEVQRSSNAFSSQPTRLPAKSKALKWFQQLSESTPVFYLPFCHRTKALKGFVIKPIRSNIPPRAFYSTTEAPNSLSDCRSDFHPATSFPFRSTRFQLLNETTGSNSSSNGSLPTNYALSVSERKRTNANRTSIASVSLQSSRLPPIIYVPFCHKASIEFVIEWTRLLNLRAF